ICSRVRDTEMAALSEGQIIDETLRGAVPDIKAAAASIEEAVSDILRNRALLSTALLCGHIVDGVRIRIGSQPRQSFCKTPLRGHLERVIVTDARRVAIGRVDHVGQDV